MKKFALIAALLMTAPTASFGLEKATDLCPVMGQFAETMMEARQREVPMSTLFGIIPKETSEETMVVIRQIIMAAYEQPAFKTPEIRQSAIAAFRNWAEKECYTKLG